ncbi:FHA domain-containing protein [Catenovulum adriaticum]|uniref:FHA domain-containing protein n=1 Tax=Catenovulum adriaticum TaxID=2984846 RepID=A0ABY7AKZ0_9ALTE|nr:FHA domain-containing protein [Catenovulum sp. TS8]WAJ69402.1 FHA domain-containing protein [Catenovulum sp. TS8]
MELIIQTLSRSGKVSQQQKASSNVIRIGRAYDNDIILEDIHISEHHAQISQNELGEFEIEDLNSLNHVFDKDKNQLLNKKTLKSGDEFYLGKLRIKILSPHHPVAETIALTKSEETAEFFSSKLFFITSFSLFISLFALTEYLTFFGEFKIKQLFNPVLSLIFALTLWPIFWSLLSRFFKHEARFWAHLSTLLITLLSLKALTSVSSLVAYNTNGTIANVMNAMVGFVIVFACLRFSLYLFNQKRDRRQLWLSFSLSCFLFGLASLGYYAKHKDFSARPSYSGLILPSQFLLKDSISIGDFVDNNSELYSSAQQEAREKKQDEHSTDQNETENENLIEM